MLGARLRGRGIDSTLAQGVLSAPWETQQEVPRGKPWGIACSELHRESSVRTDELEHHLRAVDVDRFAANKAATLAA
jgi:hypothetical protein